MHKLMIAAASCCVVIAAASGAKAATLSVDPKVNCFDLTNQLYGTKAAYLALPNGKYTVSMTSSATLGASGGTLDKVYFYMQTPNRPFSSLNIISTRNPNNIAVNGNGSLLQNGITAFIVDSQCSDNVGTITITVQPRTTR